LDPYSLCLILASAVLHAGWNLFVKKDEDKFLSLSLMAATSGGLCTLLVPQVGWPTKEVWGYLAVSAPLHAGYRICLSAGYQHGELSKVYPIARGATPLFVTALSMALFEQSIAPLKLVGIAGIACAIMGFTFQNGFPKEKEGRAIAFALGTAAFIAVFTLVDSVGSKLSESSIAYVIWLFILEGVLMLVVSATVAYSRLQTYIRTNGLTCVKNGAVMSLAHGLVIVALSRSEPALVSALRETSVVFGVLFGALFLGEKLNLSKLICTATVTAGLLLTVLG
jgi:drug/metabolite transporter (DMT)-like permease